jgi:hypothetical protein
VQQGFQNHLSNNPQIANFAPLTHTGPQKPYMTQLDPQEGYEWAILHNKWQPELKTDKLLI